jgi:(2Fe-2S) ferredoxin
VSNRHAGARSPRCAITVCHGCCCGTESKHTDIDSAGHRATLLEFAADSPDLVRVQVSDCLDACDRSNVLVIRPSAAGRRRGGRPVWLGAVLRGEQVDAVTTWIRDGGPGVSAVPPSLRTLVFHPRPGST